MDNVITLSEEDLVAILCLLREKVDTLEDDGGTCERLLRLLRRSSVAEVYMVLTKTEVYGAWTDPHDAIAWIFDDEPEENLEDEMIKMLISGNPVLVKIPINAGEPWKLNR